MKIENRSVPAPASARLGVALVADDLHRFNVVLRRVPARHATSRSTVAARPGRTAHATSPTATTMKKTLILTTLALGLGALTTIAQDAPPQRPGGPGFGGPRGGPGGDFQRPNLPVLAALDANKDGVIDANEINNAAAALRTLDKNGDGQLTREELMPPRPEGFGGPGEGRGPGRGRPGADRQPPAVQ
jgi:hypothetical protein